MVNKICLVLCLMLLGCGQKSTIKNDIRSESFESAYGDGKHIITPLVLTISNGLQSPLEGMGLIAGGIVRFVGDIFAATTDLGLKQMSYTQPIPFLPKDVVKEVRVKRVFFYIKPEKGDRHTNFLQRWLFGMRDVNFKFLDKIAVRMSTVDLIDPHNYKPKLLMNSLSKKEFGPLMEIFSKHEQINNSLDPRKLREVILLKYDKDKKDLYVKNSDFGRIFIFETDKPKDLKIFLEDHPKLQGYFERIHKLENAVLVELVKDPVIEEGFKIILSESETEMENLGVTLIDGCTKESCLELVVPNINLIPIAVKGNALKFDALINADKVPSSFKLNGFVEFEIRSQLRIR
jgi:hypothetical protein